MRSYTRWTRSHTLRGRSYLEETKNLQPPTFSPLSLLLPPNLRGGAVGIAPGRHRRSLARRLHLRLRCHLQSRAEVEQVHKIFRRLATLDPAAGLDAPCSSRCRRSEKPPRGSSSDLAVVGRLLFPFRGAGYIFVEMHEGRTKLELSGSDDRTTHGDEPTGEVRMSRSQPSPPNLAPCTSHMATGGFNLHGMGICEEALRRIGNIRGQRKDGIPRTHAGGR